MDHWYKGKEYKHLIWEEDKKNPNNVEIKQNHFLLYVSPVFNLGCGKRRSVDN